MANSTQRPWDDYDETNYMTPKFKKAMQERKQSIEDEMKTQDSLLGVLTGRPRYVKPSQDK